MSLGGGGKSQSQKGLKRDREGGAGGVGGGAGGGRASKRARMAGSTLFEAADTKEDQRTFISTLDEKKKQDEESDDFIVIPLQEGFGNTASSSSSSSSASSRVLSNDKSESADVVMSEAGGIGDDGDDEDAREIRMEDSMMRESKSLSALPPLMRNRVPGLDKIDNEQEKLRMDVSVRPDTASLRDYERTPIEKFGAGLLRGMGWVPGAPIGKSGSKVVEVVKFVKRPAGLGLGAQPKAYVEMDHNKGKNGKKRPPRILRQGESREPKKLLVLPKGADGRTRHVRNIDEVLVEAKEPFYDGCTVDVIKGPHKGFRARLLSKTHAGLATVRLPSEVKVKVYLDELRQVPDHELKRDRERDRRRPSSSSSSRHSSRTSSKATHPSSSSSSSSKTSSSSKPKSSRDVKVGKPPANVWLRRDIRVKVLSKTVREGRYYCKVGWIADVLPLGRSLVRLEDGGKLVEFSQRDLESVVPKVGGLAVIIAGKNRGEKVKVIERNSAKNKVAVQNEDYDIYNLTFDDVAQCH
eukprot:TRINITY_DN4781_c0_g1_i1.p1 TRINITY_DN4781_c0_g1~~TRINITY_DN4781_c0_g1_i1.p1  ORF type:complete len:563 (-),score=119.02 TRINITY_DN4781_c0_g1_i1:30-1598(-)